MGISEFAELRERLTHDTVISKPIWLSFFEADELMSPIPAQWLASNLAVLYRRLLDGETLAIEGEDTVLTRDNFAAVIEENFYNLPVERVFKLLEQT